MSEKTLCPQPPPVASDGPEPINRPKFARQSVLVVVQTGLFVLAVLYTLHFARPILLPIVLAVLLSFLLGPIVRSLKGLRVPEPVGAGLVLLGLVTVIGFGIQQLAEPASVWLTRAPRTFRDLGGRLRVVTKPVKQASKVADEAEKITDVVRDTKTPQVEIKQPSLSDVVLSETWELLLGTVITLTLLYFVLASGDLFLNKLVKVSPRFSKKKHLIEVTRQIERGVSVYLIVLSLTNLFLGLAVALALAWLGMPNPVLWGVVAGVLNYIPYLGAIATLVILALVATATFQQLGQIALVLFTFLMLTSIEGMVIRPVILGRRLALNPVGIFIALIFWGWIWGVPGALLAVPLLATTKIICDQFDSLSPVSEFLDS